jgi:membrane fusion protein (multidrug efflux system)
MKKKIYIILIFALCLLSCNRQTKAQRERKPLKVKTMVVSQQGSATLSRYVGTVEPIRETPLSMQSAGRVVAVSAKNGQHVRAGQTLLEIDNTQALNALNTAEASLKHAQDGYDRVKSVHEKGVVSDQKMVEIESQLAQAKSLYAAAKKQVEECTLIAPCEGIVSGLDVQRGQTVIPGARLCTMLDVSGFSVRFSVPEAEVRNLAAAGEVECSAADTVLPITVTERNMTANALTHTYEVTARIQGGAEVLMSGMVGVVRVESKAETQNSKAAIVIPAKCVLLKQEGPTVWVVENGEAVRRSIVSGGYQADGVQVREGLHPGDTLIIEGYQKLYTGCKVEI